MRYCAFLLLLLAAHCLAQIPCSSAASSIEAAAALTAQNELRRVHVDDMEEGVSRQIATQMAQFKDRLTRATDVALTCAGQSISPADLQDALARSLHANLPEPRTDQSISRNDPNYAEITGSWGHDLQVRITRPAVPADLLEVRYSVNIECGDDTLLLAYEWQADRWRLRLRWQAPELHTILDAHGDFFLTAYLANPAAEPRVTASGSPAPKTAATWLVAVAHGRPWCTSRFSGFLIDLLAPGPDPASPQIVWQTKRIYSRGDVVPRIKSAGNTFELRLNERSMDIAAFERPVVFRYRVDPDQSVHRVQPMGMNARGFVEEWLSAPWAEASEQVAPESSASLQKVHADFDPPVRPDSNQFTSHTYGPVRACAQPGVFQVEIRSTLKTVVPGKPGGDSSPLPAQYFFVREVRNGYRMISAASQPASACNGVDLMPKADR